MPASTPNFALRRATVVLIALLVVGGLLGFVLSLLGRDTSDDGASGGDAPVAATWDVVVLDDPVAGVVTVHTPDGTETTRVSTGLQGVVDVGLPGEVVLGVSGDVAALGLGVLDLATGIIDPIDIRLPLVERLGTSPFLVASDQSTGAVRVIDVARRRVIDLTELGGDDAVVLPDSVRVTDDAAHLVFSELRTARTVVVDLTDTGDPPATLLLPGLLADVTDTRIATVTNRGTTMLVDLYDTAGARLGTTETVPLVGVMVVGDTTLVGVGADASVVRIDAAEQSATTNDDLQQRLDALLDDTADTAAGIEPDSTARSTAVLLDHDRLAVAGTGWLAFVDAGGAVVATTVLDDHTTTIGVDSPTQRCVLMFGSSAEPSTLIDGTDGATLATIDPSLPVGMSLDGCTVARMGFGATAGSWRGFRVVGPDLDERLSERVAALSPDGTVALVGRGSTSLLRFDDDSVVPLTDTTTIGTFARSAASVRS